MNLYSIGHSNIPVDAFLKLLRSHGIEILVDVRSQPYSRYNPQFNRESLKRSIEESGIRYAFLGDRIGGKPQEPGFLLENGRVDYAKLSGSERFLDGLRQLRAMAERNPVSFMCAEADFRHCHRYRLITRALLGQGVEVKHILHDGRLAETDPRDFVEIQPRLF